MSDLIKRSYLIRKAGAWYRPGGGGYTYSAIQAGRFTLEEAEMHTHPNGPEGPRDGMRYVHEDVVDCDDWQAFRAQAEALAAKDADIARLREAAQSALRAADLALFVIRKQGVMPNSSWQAGFERDTEAARQALGASHDA